MSQNPRRGRGRGRIPRNQRQEEELVEENKSSDLAEEDRNVLLEEHEDSAPSDEESGEDLMGDNMMRDYIARPEQDRYEEEGIDDNPEYEDMTYEQRRAAEREIYEREGDRRQQQRGGRRMPQALRELSEGGSDEDDFQREYRLQRQRQQQFEMIGEEDEQMDEMDQAEEEKYLDMEECRGKLKTWMQDDKTSNWIKRTFRRFLLTFQKENDNNEKYTLYKQQISEMCNRNKQSLEVAYDHISIFNSVLSLWIAEEPSLIFPLLNDVAFKLSNKMYPGYYNIQSEVYVRIIELPVLDLIRELRQRHLGQLIRVIGVITKRSPVYSQLKTVVYDCLRCGEKKGPFFLQNNEEVKIGACASCSSEGPFKLNHDEIVYRNFQKITLQESPSQVQPGRVPRQKEVVLLADNIDIARPGDEIEVTGIYTHRYDYSLNAKHGFPLFYTHIEANHVKRLADLDNVKITHEDQSKIKQLSKDPNIARKIINSIGTSIYGHHNVKTALALAMFGGVAKDIGGKHKIRGDINVLLLGDPGTAKSQFLKNVEKTFYRCVYTTGKGASAVGLTAAVHRDFATKEWTLEGGALVLADKGICLIDEFDKMNEHDRTSIHEAMEQQSISISKAGIVSNLQARCSVIAAANPIKGQYDSQMNFHDNVDLTDPILSRFDILCVIKDQVTPENDNALAAFVINSHIKNHPKNQKIEKEFKKNPEQYSELFQQSQQGLVQEPQAPNKDIIELSLLKQYIMYARQKVHPKLQNIDKEKITKFYTELRQEAEISGGINIAVRHLESIIRMAEAHARMHLRDTVNDIDTSLAISVMLDSFLQSQKYSVANNLKKKFSHYITFREDSRGLVLSIVDRLYNDQVRIYSNISRFNGKQIVLPLSFLEREAKKLQITIQPEFFKSENFTRVYKIDGSNIFLI